MVDKNKPVKTGFEVLTEVETIVSNLDGLIDALCLVDNCFSLDNETLSECEKVYLLANYTAIRNIHNIVETALREIADKIAGINLNKESSDPETTIESAN